MDSQPEFFEDLPRAAKPLNNFAEARVDEKILPFPFSRWKDGRMRADLSAYDLGEFVSRNERFFWEEIVRRLQEKFNAAIVEMVSQVAERESACLQRRRRVRKKDLIRAFAKSAINPAYANPFSEIQSGLFVMCPDWLAVREDLKDPEKLIYGRLLFPLRICKSWDKNLGIIVGLDQEKLGKSLGRSRQWAHHWLVSMELKRWLECTGPPGAKKDKLTRFFWKDGMPETCHTSWQVSAAKYAAQHGITCHTSKQQSATQRGSTCHTAQQVSEAIEKREPAREEENAQPVGDDEWLRTIIQAKFPHWTFEQLKLQWLLHRKKGKEKGEWIPGDRNHFLVAWMPRAGDSPFPRSRSATAEPSWWSDFLSECYPNAKVRDFSRVQKLPFGPGIVKEGFEWAKENAGSFRGG